MTRKIILSCSEKKIGIEGLTSAIDRYDGIYFRLLKRYVKNSAEKLDVFILSAEFGLIQHSEKIPAYERKMNSLRAEELHEIISMQFKQLILPHLQLSENHWFVNLGKSYWKALNHTIFHFELASSIKCASGSSGKRLAEMYDWLYGENSQLRNIKSLEKNDKSIFFRGKEIKLTRRAIIKIARQNLEIAGKEAFAFQSWFVEIDNKRVSPKWLVNKLTGFPVSSFHSDEARKLLQRLGIDIIRF